MARPSKIITAAAELAAQHDPTITSTRVDGWINAKRYILRPTEPLSDEYISCLIDLSRLTGRSGRGKSIGVVTALAQLKHTDFVPFAVLRNDVRRFLARRT